MRIIKIYTVNVWSANHYRDTNYENFYSRADAYRYLCDFAQDWKEYSDHGYDSPEIMDVGCIYCNLVPINDGVTPPEDPSELFSDDNFNLDDGSFVYLDLPPYTDFCVEHEMPYGGDSWTLYADGHIEQMYHDGRQSKTMEKYINDWKSRGWDGKVEEVIL